MRGWILGMALLCGVMAGQDRQLIRVTDKEESLVAKVSPADGGELCSLQFKHKGQWVELLYRACDYSATAGWRGKAPLLWPATGSTKTGGYTLNGKRHEMPAHGFVQRMPWMVENADPARTKLRVAATPATRAMYPYGWQLTVDYALAGGKLTFHYQVTADKANGGKMPFSIGNHITFRTPLLAASDLARMTIETGPSRLIVKDAQNLPTGEVRERPFPSPTALANVRINPALSLGDYSATPELILRDPQGLRIRMTHQADRVPAQPFVQYNLWGNINEGYFCPEPWVGLQNSFQLNRGRVELAPGESWNWTITIEVADQ
ncbi:MAG: hypothetical protein HY820_18335 [Acidobacteria bacterium]|nr:hypothetical protein [Acidobacteriota bacterium]